MMSSWKALIAVAAVATVAAPSQAGLLTLTLTDSVGSSATTTGGQPVSVMLDAQGNGHLTGTSSNALHLDGYTVSFASITAVRTGQTEMITVNGAVFSGTGPANTPQTFNLMLTASGLTSPVGPTAILSNTLSSTSFVGSQGNGSAVGTQTVLGANHTTPNGVSSVGGVGAAGTTAGSTKWSAPFGPVTGPYDLKDNVTLTTFGGAANIHFTSKGTVALPEPGSIVATIAGAPFALGIVGLLRRRLTRKDEVESTVAA
jgi:hypothetical protein